MGTRRGRSAVGSRGEQGAARGPDLTSVERLLAGKGVVICAGPGGVGKTTTSAAIAAGMAARGLRVGVVTIDPARRLADALGISGGLGNEPRQVDPERLAEHGLDIGDGELWAMMLDSKRTFDALIEKVAPSEAARDEVLGNRIYQEISSAVAGSQEFTAISKLDDLHREGGQQDGEKQAAHAHGTDELARCRY